MYSLSILSPSRILNALRHVAKVLNAHTLAEVQSTQNPVEEESSIELTTVRFNLLRPGLVEWEGVQRPEYLIELCIIEHLGLVFNSNPTILSGLIWYG